VHKERYLQLLQSDGLLLASAAASDLTVDVPTCPGWTVADLVRHTAEVYEHKIACIGLMGEKPDPWPPSWPDDRDPLQWFNDAHARLIRLLTDTDRGAPSWTWWPDDQTAGFWVRRMAQETAVHRTDAQSAFGPPTPVDDALALDGIDEVLHRMLAGDWSEEPQPGSTGQVTIAAAARSWTVRIRPEDIEVIDGGPPSDTPVSGEPSDLLLWLWGRLPDSVVGQAGQLTEVRALRERLRLATQ
jgi:uncharacterized protein (TIGR03083 family)